ncbi:serine/threonine-protein kinase [Nocardiopsis potens]|uniref:serine/threonine-protein kinase n=1 Tax=Nocardiopsis potens TaxID=1246458 RepID=UPI000346EFEF|nr:serine/threonine-protein kinase [Nocardiopsis potens]
MAPGSEPTGAPLPPELRPLREEDPRRIGPYRVAGRLGQGGMGTVFGAIDADGRCIAVKVVSPRHASDPAFRAAFTREVELMRRVGGVCAVAVHGADTRADPPWVATDFIPGPTLGARVREGGPLEGEMLTAFAAGTAEALAAIHAAGIVHCDVKPGNVILSPDGPRVLDFGIARPVASRPDPSGAVFGSPGWVSPERFRGALPAPASDVFAWGALVAYAATGRSPFDAADTAERQRRAVEEAPDLDGVPAGLVPMLQAALDKDPAHRPDAESIYRGLLDYSVAEDISTVPTADLAGRLRGLLSGVWTGIDASWHDPRLWAAAAGTAAAGLGAAAAGSAVAGAAGAGAGASGTAGAAAGAGAGASGAAGAAAGASAASGTAAGAGAGAGLGSTAAVGGAGKLAAVVTAAVVGTVGVGVGGLFVARSVAGEGTPQAEASPSPTAPPTPEEAVAGVIELFETAESYHAVLENESSPDDPAPRPVELSYVHRSDPDFYQRHSGGTEAVDAIYDVGNDRNLQYGPAFVADFSPSSDGNSIESEEDARAPVLRPFRDLAESMEVREEETTELDGTPATLISGDYQGSEPDPRTGEDRFEDRSFSLWISEQGVPLRLEYTRPESTTPWVWTYSSFDGDLDRWNCGAVSAEPAIGEVVLIATSPDISCSEGRPVVEGYLETPEAQEGNGPRIGFEGWTCFFQPFSQATRMTAEVGSCTPEGAEQGERLAMIQIS